MLLVKEALQVFVLKFPITLSFGAISYAKRLVGIHLGEDVCMHGNKRTLSFLWLIAKESAGHFIVGAGAYEISRQIS